MGGSDLKSKINRLTHDIETKKHLYIPVKTLDADDFIEGIGILELAICGVSLVIILIISVILAKIFINNLVGIGFAIFSTIVTVSTIRRDSSNENLIQKIFIILRFIRKQKVYLFERNGEEIS